LDRLGHVDGEEVLPGGEVGDGDGALGGRAAGLDDEGGVAVAADGQGVGRPDNGVGDLDLRPGGGGLADGEFQDGERVGGGGVALAEAAGVEGGGGEVGVGDGDDVATGDVAGAGGRDRRRAAAGLAAAGDESEDKGRKGDRGVGGATHDVGLQRVAGDLG